MNYRFTIPFDGHNWCYSLLSYSDHQVINVDGFVYFGFHKKHSHHYELIAFFYRSKRYVYPRVFRSKRELYGAIQELLQEELNIDVQ